MKKLLTIFLTVISMQMVAQENLITSININLPTNPDPNTANWGTGTSVFTISAATTTRYLKEVLDSKMLLTIKKGGSKVCGSYTSGTAPACGFNSLTKVWSGRNAVSFLGQDCELAPGDYELCIQFFSPTMPPRTLAEEVCRPFSIRAEEPQTFQAPQAISPANGLVINETDVISPVTFRWTPVVPKPKDEVVYKVRVFEIRQGQSATEAMKSAIPLIDKEVINQNQLPGISLSQSPIAKDSKYGWYVQATDREGRGYGMNDGKSEVFSFSYGKDSKIIQAINTGNTVEETDSAFPCELNGHTFLITGADERPEYELSKVVHYKDKSSFGKYELSSKDQNYKELDLDDLAKMNANLHVLIGGNKGRVIIPIQPQNGPMIWVFEDDKSKFKQLEKPEVTTRFSGSITSSEPQTNKNFSNAVLSIESYGKPLIKTSLNGNGEFTIPDFVLNVTEPFDFILSIGNQSTYHFYNTTSEITPENTLKLYCCEGGLELTTSIKDVQNMNMVIGQGRSLHSWWKSRVHLVWASMMNKRDNLLSGDGKAIPLLITCQQDPALNNIVITVFPDPTGNPVLTVVNDIKLESNLAEIEYSKCTLLDLETNASLTWWPWHSMARSNQKQHQFKKSCESRGFN